MDILVLVNQIAMACSGYPGPVRQDRARRAAVVAAVQLLFPATAVS